MELKECIFWSVNRNIATNPVVVVVQVFVVFDLVVQNTFVVVVVGSQVVQGVVVFVAVVEQVGSLGWAVVMVVVPLAVEEVACVVVWRVWTAVVFGWC